MLAWRQYSELVELRAASLNRDERSDLQKRIWDLEKSNRELRDQLAVQRDAELDPLMAASDQGERPGRERGGRGERGRPGREPNIQQQANAIRELMSKPEVQAMVSLQQKTAIESRYAALFRNLNLTPEQSAKLTSLLADRAVTLQDVMTAAREQGISPRENPQAFQKLIADVQNDLNNSIKTVIGEQGLTQLTNYEQTLPQRNLVNDLQQRLSYTNTPLTAMQAEQLVQILATNGPQPATAGTSEAAVAVRGRGGEFGGMIGALGGGPGLGMLFGAFDGGGRGGNGTAPVTASAVTQAQTVLAAPQVAALQQIQQQQQAQQQLRKLVTDTLSANQTKSSPSTGSSTPTTSTTPKQRRGGG